MSLFEGDAREKANFWDSLVKACNFCDDAIFIRNNVIRWGPSEYAVCFDGSMAISLRNFGCVGDHEHAYACILYEVLKRQADNYRHYDYLEV